MKSGNEAHGAGILVVDDDASLASTLREFLAGEGYSVEVALSAAEALAIHTAHPQIALALVDLIMPVTDGLALTDELRRRNPDIAVVIMTGYGTIETAVDAIKRGAEDYITKPFDYEAVRKKVARLMEVNELRERVAQLEKNLERHPSFENIVSLSPAMERVIDRARMAAGTDASLLVLGETGTGKEMLARAIHAASQRARMPFVAVNSAALPRELAETWRWMCPAGVYEIPEDAPEHGPVDVIVNYTNCVQCGAITAKGGRLTPPEGGDGPLYQIV